MAAGVCCATLEALAARVGEELVVGDWVHLDQARIDAFAAVSEDRQWIHVDPARAADSPFGGTIAHGMLVLAVAATAVQAVAVDEVPMSIVYGIDRVRFIHPAPAGCRVRARVRLVSWSARDDGGDARWGVLVEGESLPRPVAAFELIVRYLRGGAAH